MQIVVGDAAAQSPDAAEAPVVTLLLPPLNLLATIQNSSEEEGNTPTRPRQARVTSQIMSLLCGAVAGEMHLVPKKDHCNTGCNPDTRTTNIQGRNTKKGGKYK